MPTTMNSHQKVDAQYLSSLCRPHASEWSVCLSVSRQVPWNVDENFQIDSQSGKDELIKLWARSEPQNQETPDLERISDSWRDIFKDRQRIDEFSGRTTNKVIIFGAIRNPDHIMDTEQSGSTEHQVTIMAVGWDKFHRWTG